MDEIKSGTTLQNIIDAIRAANPTRNEDNLHRRIIKLGEEYGEAAEAYLNVSSARTGKAKTWDDVREELADVLIVAVDVALTPQDFCGDYVNFTYPCDTDYYVNFEDRLLDLQHRIGKIAKAWSKYSADPSRKGHEKVISAMEKLSYCAMKLALCPLPDKIETTFAESQVDLAKEIDRKLTKWQNNRDTGQVATDAE